MDSSPDHQRRAQAGDDAARSPPGSRDNPPRTGGFLAGHPLMASLALREAAAARPLEVAVTVTVNGLPARALADEPFTLVLAGLAPRGDVTIEVRLDNWLGGTWRGAFSAHADAAGVLDLAAVAFTGFAEPDPAALLWAAEPDAEPDATAAGAEDVHGVLTAAQGGRTVARHEFTRVFRDQGVTCTELVGPLAGALYLPGGPGPHPAVMTVSGSGGGIGRAEAAMLASRGFACLALAYFNYPGRPPELADQPLEYFGQALDWLAGRPQVRAGAIAVKGNSRGGELSLLLGSTFEAVRAVVAVVPSGYVWGAARVGWSDGAAWTWRGRALPRVPVKEDTEADANRDVAADGAIKLTPGFRAALARATPGELAQAEIPVERTNGPILILCGEADDMWPAVELTDVVLRRTAQAGFPHAVRRLAFPDAGHSISLPYLPVRTSGVHPLGGRYAYGGTRAGTAAARVAVWRQTLEFLAHTDRGA
jgi:dienelactone hydrolase